MAYGKKKHAGVKSDSEAAGRPSLPKRPISPTHTRGKIRTGRVAGEKRAR